MNKRSIFKKFGDIKKGEIFTADVSKFYSSKKNSSELRPVVVLADKKEKFRSTVLVCICCSLSAFNIKSESGFFIKSKVFDKKTFIDVYTTYCIPASLLKRRIGKLTEEELNKLDEKRKYIYN